MIELERACNEHKITASSIHLGISMEGLGAKNNPMDRWYSTIIFGGRNESFDFYTGLGWRKISPGFECKKGIYINKRTGDIVARNILEAIKGPLRLPKNWQPSVADVLYCTVSDADALHESFRNWCDYLGYNKDSISAFKIYDTCQMNGEKIEKLLGRDLVRKLRNSEH